MATETPARCRCGHMKAQHQEHKWFSSSPEGSGHSVECMVPHCECQRFRREPQPETPENLFPEEK